MNAARVSRIGRLFGRRNMSNFDTMFAKKNPNKIAEERVKFYSNPATGKVYLIFVFLSW